jgi:hypothetical protein
MKDLHILLEEHSYMVKFKKADYKAGTMLKVDYKQVSRRVVSYTFIKEDLIQ